MADKSRESAKCNKTSTLEDLVHHYEQRNRELEAYEAEVANRLKILEETIPALKIWYMWRIFNAVGQPMQSPESINKLLECEKNAPCDDHEDLVYLMQRLKDFELKLNNDNLKLKDFEEAEKRLRSKIAELENNIKIKDESIVDEFAKSQFEKMEFLNNLVKDYKLVSEKIMADEKESQVEEKKISEPHGIFMQMDPHESLDGRKEKEQLDSFAESSLPEHLTQLEKEVTELQELMNQRDVGDRQIESGKGKLTCCRDADRKTEKDEVISTGSSDLTERLIQLERGVIDLQELLYQREEEQKTMEAEDEKLCSHLQKCLNHLLSFKNNTHAPLLKNLQLQKEKLNKLTKELELQKAEREQDNIIHYKELNELRKQIHKSAEDLKSVISESSKSGDDSQQIYQTNMQLHHINSKFIRSVQYEIKDKDTNVLSEHTFEELKSAPSVEELKEESESSYILSQKSDSHLKVDSGHKSDLNFSTHLSANHSPHPEHPSPTAHIPSSEHELSTQHMLYDGHTIPSEHEPSTEYMQSSSYVALAENESPTEHVSFSSHTAPSKHEPSAEHVLPSNYAVPTEQELFSEHVLSKDHTPPTEYELSAEIKRHAFEVKMEHMNEIFKDYEKSEVYTVDKSEDKSPSLHTEEASIRMEQEEPMPVFSKDEMVNNNCNIISLRDKCRVKDHMIKSLADHLKGLNTGNHWPVNEVYLNISKDPVKTYDFDRTTLIEYIEGNDPSNMTASLMSAPEYSADNPLQLQVLGKLDPSTVLVSWGPPPANNVSKFQIFVNGELRCHVHSAARNKALLSELYSMEKVVITLCALDNNGELAGKSTLVYNIND